MSILRSIVFKHGTDLTLFVQTLENSGQLLGGGVKLSNWGSRYRSTKYFKCPDLIWHYFGTDSWENSGKLLIWYSILVWKLEFSMANSCFNILCWWPEVFNGPLLIVEPSLWCDRIGVLCQAWLINWVRQQRWQFRRDLQNRLKEPFSSDSKELIWTGMAAYYQDIPITWHYYEFHDRRK